MIFLATELTEGGGIRNKAAGEFIAIDIQAAKPLQEGGFVTKMSVPDHGCNPPGFSWLRLPQKNRRITYA